MAAERPSLQLAVVVARTAAPNAWEDWAFSVAEVVPDEGVFGVAPRILHDDGKHARILVPGFRLELYADECKGYFLNLSSGRPSWFVSWVPRDDDLSMIRVTAVSVSYIEADRRLAAEEHVESLPLDDELCEWLRLYTNDNFRPDTARRQRAQSFLSPEEREAQAAKLKTQGVGDG